MTFKILFYIIFMTLSGTNQADSGSKKILPPCRDTPNCVSSQTQDPKQFIAPFKIKGNTTEAWQALKELLNKHSRITITHEAPNIIHAEATSLVFQFVDDIDFILDAENKTIHIRSASRVGHTEFGVNHKRIEALRLQLQKAQVIS